MIKGTSFGGSGDGSTLARAEGRGQRADKGLSGGESGGL